MVDKGSLVATAAWVPASGHCTLYARKFRHIDQGVVVDLRADLDLLPAKVHLCLRLLGICDVTITQAGFDQFYAADVPNHFLPPCYPALMAFLYRSGQAFLRKLDDDALVNQFFSSITDNEADSIDKCIRKGSGADDDILALHDDVVCRARLLLAHSSSGRRDQPDVPFIQSHDCICEQCYHPYADVVFARGFRVITLVTLAIPCILCQTRFATTQLSIDTVSL